VESAATVAATPDVSSAETRQIADSKNVNVGVKSSEDSMVSQRQPSQLKSSVRSLAYKDEMSTSGGLSFASKKLADVEAPSGVKKSDSEVTSQATAQTEKVED